VNLPTGRRPRRSWPWLAAASLALSCACGDAADLPKDLEPGVRYPLALTPLPGGTRVLVWGANFDRMYRAGKVRAFDTRSERWTGSDLEVAGFVGGAALQLSAAATPSAPVRALMTSRETDDITLVSFDKAEPLTLSCGGHDAFGRCSRTFPPARNEDTALSVGADPMGIEVRPWAANRWLVTTVALGDGRVSLLLADDKGTVKPAGHLGLGAGVIAVRTAPATGVTYVSDARAPALHTFTVRPDDANPTTKVQIVAGQAIALPAGTGSDFAHGLALSADGGRLYVAHRSPAALIAVDVAAGVGGKPRNVVAAVVPLGGLPSELTLAPTGPGGTELAYVSSFGDDAIWVVDPGLRQVVQRIALPHAPYGLATADVPQPTGDKDVPGGWTLYATLFGAHQVVALSIGAGPGVLGARRTIRGAP